MRTQDATTCDKLRGGFYSPDRLVRVCLDRIAGLNGHSSELSVLEPSVGDGAFLRGLALHPLAQHVTRFTGIEVSATEADKARLAARSSPFVARILTRSAIEWAAATNTEFDVAVGNPPFVRYQFVADDDLPSIRRLGERLNLEFAGVSNLWIPVLAGALSRLRLGGLAAVIVPSELFTGVSAGVIREWLVTNFEGISIDLFAPGSFPGALQEVIVLSCRRAATARAVRPIQFVDHGPGGQREQTWRHQVPAARHNWTRYLLEPAEISALEDASMLSDVWRLGDVARIEVSTVTGANGFFSVTSSERAEFDLGPWAIAMLPRIRHASGLRYTRADHRRDASSGVRSWLLDFALDRPAPMGLAGPRAYLSSGEARGLNTRYKTSIREPWYRVPVVPPGTLLMSKRAHRYHRLVLNQAGVVTTDTIYRGTMHRRFHRRASELVAGFHNSLTLLTAELEGRSFGGGVLELVPSEISRLRVPMRAALARRLAEIDRLVRNSEDEEMLVTVTDDALSHDIPAFADLLDRLSSARQRLQNRRLSRN